MARSIGHVARSCISTAVWVFTVIARALCAAIAGARSQPNKPCKENRVHSKTGVPFSSRNFVAPAILVGLLAGVAAPLNAQGLVNGDFDTRTPGGPGASGTPSGNCQSGDALGRYSPSPWGMRDTPDYNTQKQIGFSTSYSAISSLTGFNTIPGGGCFIGFRSYDPGSAEGVYQSILISDASQELQWNYKYTEYTKPRGIPLLDEPGGGVPYQCDGL